MATPLVLFVPFNCALRSNPFCLGCAIDKLGVYASVSRDEPFTPPRDQPPDYGEQDGTAHPSVDPNGVNPPEEEVKPKLSNKQMLKNTFGSCAFSLFFFWVRSES